MSVIVKGMEMPTCCEWCEVEKFKKSSYGFIIDSWCPAISNEPSTLKIRRESRHSLCPLQPLPEKHGRLIDGNELQSSFRASIDECKKWIKELEENGDNETLVLANQAFCTFVEAALRLKSIPTIVEAEGE